MEKELETAFTQAEGAAHTYISGITNDVMGAAGRPKAAFTLAEVLIVITIIGIVAAMTIPTLVHNYKRKQASIKIKHFYSMMTQAIQLSEVENGSALYWNKPTRSYDEDENYDNAANMESLSDFYDTYLKNYIKTSKIVKNDASTSSVVNVYFNDGSSIAMYNGECLDIHYYVNGYDTNKTYTSGKDVFIFLFCTADTKNSTKYHPFVPNRAFGSYTQQGLTTRELALQKCKTSGTYCTVLLEIYDNFEFKEDYPYKL